MIQTIIFDKDKGGHFLDWSLYYVSGRTEYFYCKEKKFLPLTDNPVQKVNSHNHHANFSRTLDGLEELYSNADADFSVSFHQMDTKEEEPSFDLTGNKTKLSIELAKQKSNKIILLKNHKDFVLFDFTYRRRNTGIGFYKSDDEYFANFVDKFFKTSQTQWSNFNNIWDKREFIALNLDPFDNRSIENYHEFDFEHYAMDTRQLWFDFEIHKVLDYLELPCVKTKLDDWNTIYKQWLELHKNKINFCLSFNEIIDNIIQNKSMDLTKFDLDLFQEAAIQHTLIHKHNLNLKTWELEKFLDTSQLHNLLEDNIHF